MSRDWPVPVVLVACAVLVALLLLAVDQGRAAMCQLHQDEPPSYCQPYISGVVS